MHHAASIAPRSPRPVFAFAGRRSRGQASGDLVAPALDRALGLWLTLGLTAVLLLPAARAHSALIGWLPYWLVVAPALMLALRHRFRLTAALAAYLVAGRRRRRRSSAQARPLRRRVEARASRAARPVRRPLRRALIAALRFGF